MPDEVRITTPFDFESTAQEVVKGVDLSGKRVLITGGATGIGLETTRALALAGAEIVVACRNVERAEKTFASDNDFSRVTVNYLDLADLLQVNHFAQTFAGPLDILINNSGIMGSPVKQITPAGVEMMFAVNHLGHFALSLGLHKALNAANNPRVVSVSSQAHSLSPVNFDDINFDVRPYDPTTAYAQSKTANALFAIGAAAHWDNDCIYVNAVTPGAILTGLQHLTGGFTVPVPDEQIKTPEQGAATTVLCAASPLLDGVTGKYFSNCNEGIPCDVRRNDMNGILPFANDPELAGRLWDVSLELVREGS